MRNKALFLFAVSFICVLAVSAQTEGVKASLVPGDVVSISDKQIVIKTKDAPLNVELTPKTEFKRVSAERPSIASAVPSALADIVVGDKVVVSGVFGDDKSKLPARTVYLMAKSDIAQRNAKEAEKWSRGISGKVASVNSQTGQISVEIRNLMGSTTVVITPKEGAAFKRYAPNSVKYSEAVESSVGAVQAGDMIRAAGDKSADGLSLAAEEIVTGAFQTIAGTVKSIDVEKNEVVITNLQTKKDVTVALGTASVMKKFPEEFAQRMVQFQGAGMQGGGPGARPAGTPGASQPVQTAPPAGSQGQPGGPVRMMPGGGRGGGIDEMLERFPSITAADLKAGDMIAVSSTKNGTLDKISAIKLLAGVEPFIRAAQASGQQGRGGQQGGFNIPGLDGFDVP
jgi:hypothetical protein